MDQQGNAARSIKDGKANDPATVPASTNSSTNPEANQPKDATVDKSGNKAGRHREKHPKSKKPDTRPRRRDARQDSDSSDQDDNLESDESEISDLSSVEMAPKKSSRRRRRRKRRLAPARLAKSSTTTSISRRRHGKDDPGSDLSLLASSSESEVDSTDSESEVKHLRQQLQQLQQQVAMQQPILTAPYSMNPAMHPMHSCFGQYGYSPFLCPPAGISQPPETSPFFRSRQFGGHDQRQPFPDSKPSAHPPAEAENDKERKAKPAKAKKENKPTFRRVDFIWDSATFRYKIRDTADEQSQDDDDDDDNVFVVRRTFDTLGRYRQTLVDIKSQLLRECLKDSIGEVKGVTFVEENPKLDSDFLFLYMQELHEHYKHLTSTKPIGDSKQERSKNAKKLNLKVAHLKVLVKYLKTDYSETKRRVDALLRNGLITFEFLWVIWKPKSLIYTTTYGNDQEPRVFRAERAERCTNMQKGAFYLVEGKYFEHDGKNFGYGSVSEEVGSFHGARKITSLPCYPLRFHSDEEGVRKKLIERGKKFVDLSGVHYKSYSGMAYLKSKRHGVVKFDVQQSRVMVDTKTFGRVNPNYLLSPLGNTASSCCVPPGREAVDDDESECGSYGSDAGEYSEDGKIEVLATVYEDEKVKTQSSRAAKGETSDSCGKSTPASSGVETDGKGQGDQGSEVVVPRALTDDDYILASPVVLGFAFGEKQWLEFMVSKISEVKWNDEAWDSLVLEPETKDLIKALVTSRRNNASKTIDDVIQGKGKGLVTVLHGAPGTGKTLTAEGISELLKCPLYMMSAGELGTDSRCLETGLQRILDICHGWGAVLLLDEADVFLEKRNMSDVHRNALVSIFLRQLEYFQGSLFLTTNRVETFDEAFQSRIHIALRYDRLDAKAKRKILDMFLERIRQLGKLEVEALSDDDLGRLVRQDLNGREIKNMVSSAQDLAMNKGEKLGMKHLTQVLEVHARFGRDLKGGTGYEDAMRSYV